MKIIVAGDYCPRYRVSSLVDNDSYLELFGSVQSIINEADYAIVNFECAITDGNTIGIEKAGPCLSTAGHSLDALKWVGFDCLTLANNHFGDFGSQGVRATIDMVKSKDLDYVGGGNNSQGAANVLYKDIRGKMLAIINACEEEFSIATNNEGGSNRLDPITQYYAIQDAKQQADYVLVVVHGGHEHYQLPSPRMVDTYRFFIDAGADAVVNHHQHCYSGYEVYNGKPIFYGIGNFCFDHENNRHSKWNEGYLVELDFDNSSVAFELHPYIQCDDEAKVISMAGEKKCQFFNKVHELNTVIADKEQLTIRYNTYIREQARNYRYMFTPWSRHLLVALFNRGLLPLSTSRKKLIVLYDYLVCPSHRDNLISVLRNLLFKK